MLASSKRVQNAKSNADEYHEYMDTPDGPSVSYCENAESNTYFVDTGSLFTRCLFYSAKITVQVPMPI